MTLTEIQTLCMDALTFGRARYLQSHGKIRRLRGDMRAVGGMEEIEALVEDAATEHTVRLRINTRIGDSLQWKCTCGGGRERSRLCSHAAAILIDTAERPGVSVLHSGNEFLKYLDLRDDREESLRLQVILTVGAMPSAKNKNQKIEKGIPTLSFRAGAERMSIVRNIAEFTDAMLERSIYVIDDAHSDPVRMDARLYTFPGADMAVLRFARSVCAELKAYGAAIADARRLPLSDSRLHELFGLLTRQTFILRSGAGKFAVHGISDEMPPVRFALASQEGGIELQCDAPPTLRALDEEARFVLLDGQIFRLSEERARCLAPFLKLSRSFRFEPRESGRFLSEAFPLLREAFPTHIAEELSGRLVTLALTPRVNLDWTGGEIAAHVIFQYGEYKINPYLYAATLPDGEFIIREYARERAVMDILSQSGFRIKDGSAALMGEYPIFRFLTDGLEELGAVCEVYSSRALLALRPRRVKPNGRLSIRAGKLDFSFENVEIPDGDHAAVLRALLEKKEYVKLASGAFLPLSEEDGWLELGAALREMEGSIENDSLRIETFKAVWIDALLARSGALIKKDQDVQEICDRLNEPSEYDPPFSGLRDYQTRGFSWLCSLAELRMGGILADDMGLGKTVQALSLLEWARRKGRKVSLVVAPTSLIYNWITEASRFTPALHAEAMRGTAIERMMIAGKSCDLLVTSYAQLRRDIEFLQEIEFRYVILDEAQYIKNADSIGADAAKRLNAEARFALSGTPMENHLGELWSIFDFVLPGYLGNQNDFLRRYEDGHDHDSLERRLRPFLIRRIKKDVLLELPEKLESDYPTDMTPRQREVYFAALNEARESLQSALDQNQNKSFRALAAITRLRQICCHPSLVYPDYDGDSGKLNLLMEILREALPAGRRVLIFSQFTRMLSLIRQSVIETGEDPFYLDGSTPPLKRSEMVSRFNSGERSIFLISLRAGGTGLNLTGADLVIHYDPWWNPAAEDQATDRAHRIGQTKTVNVVRLIMNETIEEKIFDLKRRKRKDVDRIIRPGDKGFGGFAPEMLQELFR